MAGLTAYGDISPRTAAFVVKDLLKRGMPYMILEKFGQSKPIPMNNTKTIKFRRYYLDSTMASGYTPKEYFSDDATGTFDPTTKTLSEGVTPSATQLEHKDIDATLVQYGDLVTISDIVRDTHEDPILKEAIEILGEQAAIIVEKTRFNVLKAGSNVVYSNGVLRSSVNTKFAAKSQRIATRTLKRQLAKAITSVVRSTPSYGTEAIAPSFVGICHPDLEYDIRNVTAFVPAEKYGTMTPWEGEIGKIADCRYILSTIIEPWTGVGTSGATGGTNVLQNASSQANVYPILYLARDAFGMVALKGKDSIIPMVVNPTPSDSDPLAQRGHVSWKALVTTIILNDAWMVRAEVACTDDDSLT
jgi:N4-gp56 family major capsid protein